MQTLLRLSVRLDVSVYFLPLFMQYDLISFVRIRSLEFDSARELLRSSSE